MAAPVQPSLMRDLSLLLVGAQNVAPTTAEGEPMHRTPSTTSATAEQSPVRRQSTQQLNRNNVQREQREVAAQMLRYSFPIFICLLLLIIAIFVAGIVMYIKGWMVWSDDRQKPCDQPLEWWLFAMLLIPIFHCQLSSHVDERPRRLQALVMPLMIAIGTWMYYHSKTCERTNPNLYNFVKMYLIFLFLFYVVFMFIVFFLVTVIFWMHRHGILDRFLESTPGPAMAAKPGLIKDIDTVPYSRDLFAEDTDDGREPPECSICQEEFNSETPIKRTPCGHFYHEECLGNWLSNYAKTCPICRKDLESAIDERDMEQR